MTWGEWFREIPPPPNYVLWLTFLGLVLEVAWYFVGLYQRRHDRQISIVDEYWYRTIIVPICWQPILDLVTKNVQKIHSMDESAPAVLTVPALRTLTLEFAIEKNLVVGRAFVLTVFSDEAYKMVRDSLDSLEDEITEYCASVGQDGSPLILQYLQSLFWNRLTEVCSHLMKLHPNLKMPT